MFGDMMNMMGKLKETQKKVEETKKRLDTVLVDESSNDAKLKITLTANRSITSIEWNAVTPMHRTLGQPHCFEQSDQVADSLED